ncbi:hypothetical protein K7X08_003447 [Anisodus acutangulus]|uniref:Uncharacterized protein n=1 Tax=Anisodus acutangulus TaxID=402998 RepID=A0A9Q1MJ94_9SOLA|nr:hypothetical protein K7X08_003447 [Anisodus acutangulus]
MGTRRSSSEMADVRLRRSNSEGNRLKLFKGWGNRFLQDAGLNDVTQLTWGLINDTYKMDLILIHPPHLITLACIYIASVLKDKETTAWFEELRVDMNVVKNIAMEILDFYDGHKSISDERVNATMSKLAGR